MYKQTTNCVQHVFTAKLILVLFQNLTLVAPILNVTLASGVYEANVSNPYGYNMTWQLVKISELCKYSNTPTLCMMCVLYLITLLKTCNKISTMSNSVKKALNLLFMITYIQVKSLTLRSQPLTTTSHCMKETLGTYLSPATATKMSTSGSAIPLTPQLPLRQLI